MARRLTRNLCKTAAQFAEWRGPRAGARGSHEHKKTSKTNVIIQQHVQRTDHEAAKTSTMCTATVPLLWMLNRFAWRCAPWPVTPAMENDLGFLHAHQKRTARINTFLCKVAPRSATPIPRLSLARAALAQCGIQILSMQMPHSQPASAPL